MTEHIHSSPLGKATDYCSDYNAELLYPIERKLSRVHLPETSGFYGVDVWTGYELSWLNGRGLPQVAVAEFLIPADSENIVESKSFKLYLNSFNQTVFDSFEKVKCTLERDLSKAVTAPVTVTLSSMSTAGQSMTASFVEALGARSLDQLDVTIESYQPQPDYLAVGEGEIVTASLCSDLLKTNCPVTGQPDWASIWIRYCGRPIDEAGLLRYLVSFRNHQDFHEHCVERIFCDISQRCRPESLSVYARYTRRGGLDINPFRSSEAGASPPALRLLRQ